MRGSDARDHDVGVQLVAALETTPVARPSFDLDARDRRLGADLHAGLAGRAGDGHADGAGAAAREAPGAEGAVDLPHVVVEQHVGRARRAHAQERADDPRGRHRGLQGVGLEPLVEHVGRAHGHELHQAVLVRARELRKRWPRPSRAARAAHVEATSGRAAPSRGSASRSAPSPPWPWRTRRRPRRRWATSGRSRAGCARGRSSARGGRRSSIGVKVPSSGRISRPWRGRSRSRMISGRSSETTYEQTEKWKPGKPLRSPPLRPARGGARARAPSCRRAPGRRR